MQISIKGFIAPKESELFYNCADRYAFDKSQNKFAISDGVSKSFFPKIWADVLVNKWVSSKEFDETSFILDCQQEWLEQVTEIVNNPNAKWFTKNAFNRNEPGLATFVGLRFYKKKKEWFWKANALGDSFMFFVPKKHDFFSKGCVVLSSKQEPFVFDNYPDFISSRGANHKGKKQFKENALSSGIFYLMTDAVAEWFLNEKDDAVSKINVWQNQKDFERFVYEERLNKKLGDDDSAILIIKIEDDKKDNLTYISEKVSDIDELTEIQQKEIEVAEKAKEEELILQEENSNPITESEQAKQAATLEYKLPEKIEVELVVEKQIKGIIEKGKELFFGKKDSKLSLEKEEALIDEKVVVIEENQEEKEPSSGQEDTNSEIDKSEYSENNKSQVTEPKSKEKPESNAKTPNKPSQNITDKF